MRARDRLSQPADVATQLQKESRRTAPVSICDKRKMGDERRDLGEWEACGEG